jgi:hypothetical protein
LLYYTEKRVPGYGVIIVKREHQTVASLFRRVSTRYGVITTKIENLAMADRVLKKMY